LGAFLFFVCPAQLRKDTAIHASPVTDGKDEDRVCFGNMLSMEVGARGYTVVSRARDADYTLITTLSVDNSENNPESAADTEGESEGGTDSVGDEANKPCTVLHTGINGGKDGHAIAGQDLYYQNTGDTYEILPLMIFDYGS
jgi:hypothetical protein